MARLTEKGKFSARIGACAALFRAEKTVKVRQIAEAEGISEDEAARRYVVGALKAAVRRGSARNLIEALERYEAEQVGDRAVSIKTEGSLEREVRRINVINETRGSANRSHRRNMGKVLGELYVEYDARIADSALDVIVEREGRDEYVLDISGQIEAYLADYVTRLSRTAQGTIRALVRSAYSVDAIMSGKDGDAAKLKERAKYLHRNFPHNDAITTREMLTMFRNHASAVAA